MELYDGKPFLYFLIIHKNIIVWNENNSETKQARLVLKKMLDYFDIKMPEIIISENGKPFFKKSRIHFNYSHSKNFIACAIASSEVGIDIEEIDRIVSDRIAEKYLESEKDKLKRIELWVKKESFSKLKGLGLQMQFQNIRIEEIKEKNHFIQRKNYMCSIYSEENNIEFKELKLDISI